MKKKIKVFVTGDKGKLGSLVANRLQKTFEVVGYDIQRNKKEDLGDEKSVTQKMKGCAVVVHLAAIPHPHPDHSFDDYFKVNVLGTYNVLKAAQKNKVKKFIYISSTAYYGCNTNGKIFPKYFPIDEAHPPASSPGITKGKLSSYGQSKVIAEELCAYYGTNKIFEAIVLRSGPANEVSEQYPEGFDWKANNSYQKSSFWAINPPINLVNIIENAIITKEKFNFETFNVVSESLPEFINSKAFLRNEYPHVKNKRMFMKKNQGPYDVSKAKRLLDFEPIER